MQSEKEASEPADASKTELRQTWEKAAPGWAKWEHTFSAGLSAATEALIDMAGIRPVCEFWIWRAAPGARPSRRPDAWALMAA
jgi:hypothetical protein